MKTKKLPKKASDLILLALEDLRKVERSTKYEVDMGSWHSPNGKCAVCFAGSVMAYSLNANIKRTYEPDNFDEYTENRLFAIDAFREGYINTGLKHLGIYLNYHYRHIVRYSEDKGKFKRQMKSMAIMLQKNNL